MRKYLSFHLLIIFISVYSPYSSPQSNNYFQSLYRDSILTGAWQGAFQISGIELRIVFNVSQNDSTGFTATMDSPDQNAYGIKVDEVVYEKDSVVFMVNIANGFYRGKMHADSLIIKGEWNQNGMQLPLDLYKIDKVEKPKRPQEPKEPFPYFSEEVTIENSDAKIILAGTLTIPESSGKHPAVILITGSGPQNRNEEVFNHKPFLVLADYLTRNGIAVLRYDDRGIGESTGEFSKATTMDFAGDVLAAIEYLKSRKDIDQLKIGLIGHSEGGMIAPICAVQSDDIAFIILLAGTGLRGDKILLLQTELISRINGLNEEIILENLNLSRSIFDVITDTSNVKQEEKLKVLIADQYINLGEDEKKLYGSKDKFINIQLSTLLSPWLKFFLSYDPYNVLVKVQCPVLSLNGEKDLQVPPEENLGVIKKALTEGGNSNFKIIEFPGLNHLFQTSETGSPAEYGKIEETISPVVLETIYDWIAESVL